MCGLGRSFSELGVQYPTWVFNYWFFIALFTLENDEWLLTVVIYDLRLDYPFRAMYSASQEESKLQLLHWKT